MRSQPVPFPITDEALCFLSREVDDETWKKLYQVTAASVRNLLSWMDIPAAWKGQKADVAEDIVQETMVRTLKYLKQAAHGEVQTPRSLTGLALTIAKNYLRDLRKRESRCYLMSSDEVHEKNGGQEQIPALDQAVDNIETEHLFHQAAATVAQFPEKQRKAVLADLANSMHFGKQQTTLQQAFSAVGIRLQDYQRTLSTDPVERSRQASLRNLAYKRVARELSPW